MNGLEKGSKRLRATIAPGITDINDPETVGRDGVQYREWRSKNAQLSDIAKVFIKFPTLRKFAQPFFNLLEAC
jgi:hypothetical protein